MAELTRERIIAAAHVTLTEVGHEHVSLRGVARDLGVTAPALYDHFDSKNELLRALAEAGFHSLIEATQVQADQAIDRIRLRALAYVAFAAEHVELFRLMFMFRPAAVELVSDDGLVVDNAATEAFEQGAADLLTAIESGDLVDRDVTELALILWTAMHGVANVALTAPAVANTISEDVIDVMLAGLRPSD